jgi:CheY-like chemotaxis protein
MPAQYDLKPIQVGLRVPDRAIRDLLRGMLIRIGAGEVRDMPEPTPGLALAATDPDLVLADVDLMEDDGRAFFTALRHGQLGVSPFVCAVALKSNPTPTFMARLAAGGADDLLVKPVSPRQLQDRIGLLIDNRRPFVVTSDYVGPDRRRAPRDGGGDAGSGRGRPIPLIDVPNTLRQKVLGLWSPEAIVNQTAAAMGAVNTQKIIRHGFQVAFLAEYALPGLIDGAGGSGTARAADHLLRIPAVLEDLLRRWPDEDDGRSTLEAYADALMGRIEAYREAPEEPLPNPGAVKAAAYGIMALCARSADLASLATEVGSAVQAYRQRLEQLAAAKAAPPAAAPHHGW